MRRGAERTRERTWSLRVVLSVLTASGAATALTATTTRRDDDVARTPRAAHLCSCIAFSLCCFLGVSEECLALLRRPEFDEEDGV
jgi:hypothetical protein